MKKNEDQEACNTVLTDERKPFAYVKFCAHEQLTSEGDVDSREWYEFCEPNEIGDDKLPAFPVYDGPVREVAAQAGQVAVPGWVSVDDSLPDGKYCLATYQDRAGKLRIIRAMYVRQFEIEASGDECDSETNEANDMEYLKAGWYELIDNWGEYSSVHVSEGPVTHWMPLPPSPAKESK